MMKTEIKAVKKILSLKNAVKLIEMQTEIVNEELSDKETTLSFFSKNYFELDEFFLSRFANTGDRLVKNFDENHLHMRLADVEISRLIEESDFLKELEAHGRLELTERDAMGTLYKQIAFRSKLGALIKIKYKPVCYVFSGIHEFHFIITVNGCFVNEFSNNVSGIEKLRNYINNFI